MRRFSQSQSSTYLHISSNGLLDFFFFLWILLHASRVEFIKNYVVKSFLNNNFTKLFQWNTLFSWIFEELSDPINDYNKYHTLHWNLEHKTGDLGFIQLHISEWNSHLWFTVFKLQRSSNLGASFAVPKKPFSRHLLDIYYLRHHLPSSLPTKWQIHATLWANYDLVNLAAT